MKAVPTPVATKSTAAVSTQIAAARQVLRSALLKGGDTAAIRTKIADLEREHAEMVAAVATAEAEHQHEEAERLAAAADEMVTAAERRLAERIAALEPPPLPEPA